MAYRCGVQRTWRSRKAARISGRDEDTLLLRIILSCEKCNGKNYFILGGKRAYFSHPLLCPAGHDISVEHHDQADDHGQQDAVLERETKQFRFIRLRHPRS